LNNFFLYKEQVVLLDAAAIKVETPGNIVPEKSRLENLALFFAQFPVWHDQHLESLLDNVNYQGVDELRISSVTEFVKLVKKARKHRIAAYSKKLTRSSTAHLVEHRTDRMMVCDRAILSNELNNFVDTPDKYIDQGETIKAGNTSTVAIVNINQKRYLVKRYNIKNWAHDLRRIFGRIIGNNRALNSWRFSHILPMLGINTAKPFMLLERRKLRWIPRESYFLCEVLEGKTVAELVEDENISPDEKSAAIIAFKALFTVMADYGISHGDLKATNFIYVNNKLYVLDLDAMKRHKDYVSFHKSFQKDLKRFVNNWAELVDFESITEQAIQVTNTYRD
jgi:tRNA A-37 threonylcarbamoyl transferase component Bud32